MKELINASLASVALECLNPLSAGPLAAQPLAEREGFEPPVGKAHSGFRVRRIRPTLPSLRCGVEYNRGCRGCQEAARGRRALGPRIGDSRGVFLGGVE